MKIINNLRIPGKHGRPIMTDIFYEPDDQPKPVIIFAHGYKSFKDWGAFNAMAEKFARNGFVFIKFNFSHNGGTPEQVIDFPDLEAFSRNNYCIELDDLQTVIDWCFDHPVKEKYNPDTGRISLMGHSRGGGITILKASESHQVYKLVTLAGVASFGKRILHGNQAAEWKKNGVIYVANKRTGQLMPHLYQFYQNFIDNRDRLDIGKAASRLNIPHLIIHGTTDETIPFEDALELEQRGKLSELLAIEGAKHTFGASHPFSGNQLPAPLETATDRAISFLK